MKKGPAYDSGMRGIEKPSIADEELQRHTRGAASMPGESQEEAALEAFDANEHVTRNEDGSITIRPSIFGKKKGGLHEE